MASRLAFSMSGPAFPEALVTKALGLVLTGTKVSQQQGSGLPQSMTSTYFLVWGWDPEQFLPLSSLPHSGRSCLLDLGPPSSSLSSRHIQVRVQCSAKGPSDKGSKTWPMI